MDNLVVAATLLLLLFLLINRFAVKEDRPDRIPNWEKRSHEDKGIHDGSEKYVKNAAATSPVSLLASSGRRVGSGAEDREPQHHMPKEWRDRRERKEETR